jgi:hypothetical protein
VHRLVGSADFLWQLVGISDSIHVVLREQLVLLLQLGDELLHPLDLSLTACQQVVNNRFVR